ncbi:hypothetical protein GCM10022215_17690 [Nocardioides fonticola]|uniref:Uncharacterized protein n=1 Tax=Nocardioides fonticola TaxID=450363 RepID=A0ABP7XHJ8_9ACTN
MAMSTARTEYDPRFLPEFSPNPTLERLRDAIARLRRSRDRMLALERPSLQRGIERTEAMIDQLADRLHRAEAASTTAVVAATPIEAWAVLVDEEGREVSNRTFCVIEPDDGSGNRRVDRALELEGYPEEMARAVSLRLIGCDGGEGELALDAVGDAPLWFERSA